MAKKTIDQTAEEKIKEAARKIFTKNGYAATRTRDIAKEAGINLALLNYYFRSKEKLFNLVMLENFEQFVDGVRTLFNDKESSLEQKIDSLVEFYINQLHTNPDLPLFVLNEIRTNPKSLTTKGFSRDILLNSYFVQQLREELKRQKKTDLNPLHLVVNIFSMTIFPFVAAPLITRVGNLTDQQFSGIMEERKKLIPQWIKKMIFDN
ncbi:TetR/AcrR family transcriptional regulator [Flavitalea flava]